MMQAVRDATNEININFPQRISSEKRREENSLQRFLQCAMCVGQTTRHEWTERTMKTSTNRLRMFNTWREVRKAQHLQLEDVKYPSVLSKWVSSSAQRNIVRQPDRRIVENHFRDFSSVFDVVRDAPSSLVLFGCLTEILTLGGGLFTKKYIHFRKILKKIQKSQTAWSEEGDSIKIIKKFTVINSSARNRVKFISCYMRANFLCKRNIKNKCIVCAHFSCDPVHDSRAPNSQSVEAS